MCYAGTKNCKGDDSLPKETQNQKGQINTQSTNLVIGRSLLNNYTAWNIMLAVMLQDYCIAVASDNCFD